jgi:transposase
MQDAHDNPPDDLQQCHQMIAEYQRQLAERDEQLAKHASQIEELSVEIEKLRKVLHALTVGTRSEKRILSGPTQGWLPFESQQELEQARQEAEAQAEQVIQRYTVQRQQRKRPRNESLPADLPRVEVPVEVDQAIGNCCEHGERVQIGEDVLETLVQQSAKFYVEVRRFPKFACAGCPQCGVASPERPTGMVEGNRYGPSVAAAIIDGKWSQYLPLYRLQDIFASSGWTPSRSTLENLVTQAEFIFDPLLAYMKRLVQQDVAVGIDDTTCRMLLPKVDPELIPGNRKSQRLAEKLAEARASGKSSLDAKMWVYSGLVDAPYNIFDFQVSRHRDGPEDFFRETSCIVQGDCFSGNRSVVLESDGNLQFSACWSHARRKVVEAKSYSELSEQLLGMIQGLYDIEQRARQWSAEERQRLRATESRAVLDAIWKWLESPVVGDVLPKTDFGEAVRYLRNHWQALNVFVEDGRLPIDNNEVEHLMKQVALGRKAWLFVCSVAAGERSAKMMSLVSSARRHDLDVRAYIEDALEQLLAGCTDYHSLLPDVWKQSHPEAVRIYRQKERRDKAERKEIRAARRRLARS